MEWKIVSVDATDSRRLAAVAKIHMELLSFGPMAPLGERFVRVIGYELPVLDGLMCLASLEIEGELAGFIAYAEKSTGFYSSALKSHPLRVVGMLLLSVIQKPSRLFAVFRAARIVLARSNSASNVGDTAEIIAIAVAKEYNNAQFVRQAGLRVSKELIAHAKAEVNRRGARRLCGVVDGFNRPTVMMFAQLGATITPFEQAGKPMFLIVLELE